MENIMPAKVIKVRADRGNYTEGMDTREMQTVSINDPEANSSQGFPNNYIRTTKYTIITFLPKNLFEQFRRISNFYFMTVVIIQLIPQITPLVPITSILPLAFVLIVTAIKEAIEDYYRHKADKKNNTELFEVIRNGEAVTIYSQDIKTGDIVAVKNGQHFPADLVVMASSQEEGACYVETANLDGETNLKLRKALEPTWRYNTVEKISKFAGFIECEPPNEKLYQFKGRLIHYMNEQKSVYSLTHTQLLHRGAQLRNTQWVYGVVVYAGVDTKLFLNQQPPPSKFSTVERMLNRFILGIFLFQMFICLLNAVLSGFFEESKAQNMAYLGSTPTSYNLIVKGENEFSTPVYGLRNFFTYFVLFNTMIPISLWVTLELVKVGQAKFMEWDEDMIADLGSGPEGMKAKTSNLNEELGRIQHIFSDKTGTLTENQMHFWKCSIRGQIFDERLTPGRIGQELQYSNSLEETRKAIKDFLLTMSLCHSVVPEAGPTGEVVYQSQSPDETALVTTAAINGFSFVKRRSEVTVLKQFGKETNYEVLATLEFSAARRRMSVIIRDEEGRIRLLCKGADIVIYDRLADRDTKLKEVTASDLKNFSNEGLRTLVFAYKDLTIQEYEEWKDIYVQASTAIDNREERVEAACEIIENDLLLLGCTAIEDKLQDEVPETIYYLLEAGIKLWVLTGDKQETAINIGYSSRLLTGQMDLIIINAENTDICGEQLKANLERYCNKYYNPEEGIVTNIEAEDVEDDHRIIGLVIDGHSLGFALHDHTEAFLTLGKACRSVLCCRVTPLQKALVVRVVKQGEQRISLAIGDGANDVSMIQEAHVGVGIFGREGTQAARASDYAIVQFRHLKKLLCIHGRYSYLRVTGIIQYSFYKNLSFTLSMLYFSFYNGFSGQTLYDSWVITLYNIVFTSIPPFFFGFFEKDLPENIIYKHPETYRRMQRGELFTKKTFMTWILCSIWDSLVVFYGVYFLFMNDTLQSNGHTADLWVMGTIASTLAIVIVNCRMAIETRYWTFLTHIGIWGSIVAYFLCLLFYSAIPNYTMYWTFYFILSSPSFYFVLVILTVIALLPNFVGKYVTRQYQPDDCQILRERYSKMEVKQF